MENIERLQGLDTHKLMDIVKNYRQYGYDENLRNAAISILGERGLSMDDLALAGNLGNSTFDRAQELYRSFEKNSKIAFILYIVVLLTGVLIPGFLIGSLALGTIVLVVQIVGYITYLIFLIRSFLDQNQFYKMLGADYGLEGAVLYLVLGMPFYIFSFFYFRSQMKEKMKEAGL